MRFSTSRPIEPAELVALDERFRVFRSALDRIFRIMVGAAILGALGFVIGWLVVDSTPVVVVSAAFVVLVLVGGGRILPGQGRGRFEQLYLDARFESSTPVAIKEREARLLIDAPGTRSVPGHL